MPTLTIPCPAGQVSDGYHTFDELYDHRCTLFIALMMSHPKISWISLTHDDGSVWPGWFIAGMNLPSPDDDGVVTYHLPASLWDTAVDIGAKVLDKAPKWDGHTSADVVKRLQAWIAL